jgi:hypothetical protein
MTAEEARQELQLMFPALFLSPFEITSPQTIEYNCIAWAAHRVDAWWWPGGPYWPDGTPHSDTISAFCRAYGTLGFEPCESGELEIGFEKIALYIGTGSRVLHAARQLPNGRWTSKLGREWDITHQLKGLEGDDYGTVGQFLKRPIQ